MSAATESKHTPGPWKIGEVLTENDRVFPRIEAECEPFQSRFSNYSGCRSVCEVNGSTLGDRNANARLIAAAPILLEALEAIVNYDSPSALSSAIESAEQAVRLAKGESL